MLPLSTPPRQRMLPYKTIPRQKSHVTKAGHGVTPIMTGKTDSQLSSDTNFFSQIPMAQVVNQTHDLIKGRKHHVERDVANGNIEREKSR
jgi:hypothetical protein